MNNKTNEIMAIENLSLKKGQALTETTPHAVDAATITVKSGAINATEKTAVEAAFNEQL